MKLIRDKKITKSIQQVDNSSVIGTTAVIHQPKHHAPKISALNQQTSWKILIVDDEPEVHAVTRLTISDLVFNGKKIELISAMSGKEARAILARESDVAVALVDIVMETEDAGLRLVNHIRDELGNRAIRFDYSHGATGRVRTLCN
ncbi:MAG: hypothetical protein R3E08_00285 [Thiotrichaceae bacterium]